jgi:hypothetical protein
MKALARQKLDGVNKTRSNPALRGWRGQFTTDSKPIEFEGFGNYGEFAIIKRQAVEPGWVLIPSDSTGLESATGVSSRN